MAYPREPEALRQRAAGEPLAIAAQGGFWVGGERKKLAHGHVASGQMFVQYQIPVRLRCRFPLVLVHGGGGQGTDYLMTADGRPGWATFFLRAGYAVFVVDRVGHGRAPYHPDVLGPMSPVPTFEIIDGLFTAPERAQTYPQAKLHTQWPEGDAVMDQLLAGMGPMIADMAASERHMQRCGAALLDQTGPAILVTSSAGGPFGWLVADVRPKLVKAIIAIEPIGPPFLDRGEGGALAWGITATPLTFDPPAHSPAEIKRARKPAPRPGLADCFVQAEPARRLPNLAGIPIVVVTAEASWMAQDNHGVVEFLAQAGASAEHLRLEDHGIHGNGHMMMMEKNSDAIAGLICRWIEQTLGAEAAASAE
jgi:pimeloyl-ACP methyl ester carboxylesterase